MAKSTFALPTRARKTGRSEMAVGSRLRSLRQGANSASTANVTRIRMELETKVMSAQAKACSKNRLRRFGADNPLCAARNDIAIRLVPAHGALKGPGYRTGLETEFASGAGAIHKHHVLRDLYAFDWNLRLAADQTRKSRLCIGYTQCEAVRDFQRRGGQTGNFGQNVEHALQGEIFRAQQVTLADRSLLRNQEVAGGAFLNADKVQTRFDVTGHPAVEKVEYDFSGGRRFPVPWTDGSSRHRDDRRKALPCRVEHFLFSQPLGALVMADHFIQLGVGKLVGMLRTIHGNGGDGAGVDELFDPSASRSFQQILRAADVGVVDILRALRPQPVVSGDVKNALDPR